MSWEYVDLPELGTYGYSNSVSWEAALESDQNVNWFDITLGTGPLNYDGSAKSYTTSYGLTFNFYSRYSSSTGNTFSAEVYVNGQLVAYDSGGGNYCTSRFKINRETQQANLIDLEATNVYRNQTMIHTAYSTDEQAALFYQFIMGLLPVESTSSNGGGATHISRTTGLLKSLSSNLTSLLIASGAGGGGLLVNNTEYAGADAGGMEGNGTNSANQNSGNAFGQGGDGELASGGGSGLYGGYAGVKAIIPQYLQNYIDKIASFTATLNDGRSASMMSYLDSSFYSYYLSRPYSATLETGSFGSLGSNTYDFKLLNTGRLIITYNKTTAETSLSFTGFTTPSPVPLINGSRQYNYSAYVGWAGETIQIRNNGVRDFDSSVYTTSFSDLISCLSYCADHFRNVEISVNGELWTKTGSNYYVTPLNPISGGAGSGYIGNSVLSNKKMVGYNVTTSSAVDTKTETTDIFSAIAQPNIPKKNDGWVRIAFLRTLSPDDYSYLQHINELYMKVNENWLKFTSVPANNGSVSPDSGGTFDDRTYICDDFTNFRYTSQGSLHGPAVLALNGIMTIRVTVHPYSTTVTYDDLHYIDINTVWSGADWQSLVINGLSLNDVEAGRLSAYYVGQTPPEQYQSYLQASFNTLTEAIEYIYQHYAVINLYVNNSLWVSVDN